jgi:putative endopeptidase
MNKPKLSTMGIDASNLDKSVSPQQDFYQYACGGWMSKNPLTGEFARYGTFDKLAEDNQVMLKSLIEGFTQKKNKSGSIEQKIADFYALGMDSVRIDNEGFNPIKSDLARISALNTPVDIIKEIALQHTMGVDAAFNFSVGVDDKNSKENLAVFYQGGLGLPDRDYYTDVDEKSKKLKKQYVDHIVKMFELVGYESSAAKKSANDAFEIESLLAIASRTKVALRNPEDNYNKISISELSTKYNNILWSEYFLILGTNNVNEMNVAQPEFFVELNKIIKQLPASKWKAYLTWSFLNASAPYLSSDIYTEDFNFYGRTLSGRTEPAPRWKRVINATNASLGDAVGLAFVQKYFPPEAKERMLILVENLRTALAHRIENLTWMSDSTKLKAKEKLDAINVKIGYPDKWRDYSNLTIQKSDPYIVNVFRAKKNNFVYMISKLGKPVDPAEWLMTPQTVNAYYNPTTNEICFPAGILQPPFFSMEADFSVNYGAIGVVIGHEMTHGFDDMGRMYDKNGNLKNWWTQSDIINFNARTKVLVNQFSSIVVLDTVKANGEFTLGENIADQGGLNIAFEAMQIALKTAPDIGVVEGFTAEQRFFLSYANVWAQNIRDEEILRRTRVDEHSLGKWRVNGALPNIPAFIKAFNVKPGDAMYLAPEQRVSIW